MNKKILLLIGGAITSLGISTSVMAVNADGTATATVFTPITITNLTDLEFGDFDVTGGGDVIIDPTGGVSGSLTSAGAQSAGTFALTGEDGASFSISITTVSELSNGGANELLLSAYTNTQGGASGTMTGGAVTLGVGATITADGGETTGAYTGTYNVAIDYE